MRPVRVALWSTFLASLLAACPADEELLTHGYVQLEMRRGESQSENPYPGTAQVVATMQYEECLSAFYQANPGLRAEGVEGAEIFGGKDLGGEGWSDRLCKKGQVTEQADCEVASIIQQLTTVEQVTVTYTISGELEGRRLLFGPIPTEETAECMNNLLPQVRVGSNGAIKGKNAAGGDVWITEAFSPTSAVTDQGGPIRIGAARP